MRVYHITGLCTVIASSQISRKKKKKNCAMDVTREVFFEGAPLVLLVLCSKPLKPRYFTDCPNCSLSYKKKKNYENVHCI